MGTHNSNRDFIPAAILPISFIRHIPAFTSAAPIGMIPDDHITFFNPCLHSLGISNVIQRQSKRSAIPIIFHRIIVGSTSCFPVISIFHILQFISILQDHLKRRILPPFHRQGTFLHKKTFPFFQHKMAEILFFQRPFAASHDTKGNTNPKDT